MGGKNGAPTGRARPLALGAIAIGLGCAPDLKLGQLSGEQSCVSGAITSCYSGPSGTQGVGVCNAGAQTCDPTSLTWGACQGETLPANETCNNLDDDCDGAIDEENPGGGEACSTGLPSVCAEGAVVCSSGQLSCEPMTPPSVERCSTGIDENCDGRVECTGALLSGNHFGTSAAERGLAAVDPEDHRVLAGGFNGSLAFTPGGDALTTTGGLDVFVAKLDSDGSLIWQRSFGAPGDQEATAITVDAAGDIVLLGVSADPVDFGGGPVAPGVFLTKLDPSGHHLWSKSFPGLSPSVITHGYLSVEAELSVASGVTGEIFLAGGFTGTIDLGGGPLVSSTDGVSLFIARFEPDGQHAWSRAFSTSTSYDDVFATGVAADRAGRVVITGGLSYGSVDFGGGPIGASRDRGVVVQLDSAGEHLWSKLVSSSEYTTCRGIAIDPEDNIVLVGDGVTTGVNNQPSKAFLQKLSPAGDNLWTKEIDSEDDVESVEQGLHVAADADSAVIASGTFQSPIDLGGGPLSQGGVYVVKLDAAGGHVWSKSINAVPYVAATSLGEVVLSGSFTSTLLLEDGLHLTSSGDSDLFLVTLAP